MEQLENRKNYRLHNNVYVNTVESEVSGSAVETIEVVEDLSLFVVNTLDLTLEETLSEVELSCDELPDFSAVNQPVLSRLKYIFFKFQATVDPLPLAVVERFSLILVQFLDSLD
ncbi:hypothetical protein P3T76_008241 [Phytophthora citrophthora]|uniref:Uncharacterized protein n=1 Tax=Phytophthora citrophthora TaxID=4793 RepID=A0AAD9GKN0_9STRA|nr:hypothetical protein P3T76_008241 [Phytophthora citrophthora]